MNIKTVSVVGANGAMGATVAGLIAAFGSARVFLICRRQEAAENAVEVAANSVKADSIKARLIPKTYEDFEDCIAQSDWIFESVAENMKIKSEIYQRIDRCLKPGALVTTGTSGFSINELSASFSPDAQKRFFGTHFFNPPYNLTLCEVIRSRKTDAGLFADMKDYLRNFLFRDLIETTDSPAFLGNRVGFHFLNKALQYAEKFQDEGGIDYLEAILGPFTGRGMTPIATVDFVGLDVHKAIVDNIYANSKDYDYAVFELPGFVNELIAAGKLGMKSGEGLFKFVENADKSKQAMVYDIASAKLRPIRKYDLPFAKAMVTQLKKGNYAEAFTALKADSSAEGRICRHFLVSYITYGIITTQNVSPAVTDADIAMSTGYNEIVRLAEGVDFDHNLVIQLAGVKEENRKVTVLPFDFRKFFRAKL
jgi:3-hydroxyacyl-CoA dehydrogenase